MKPMALVDIQGLAKRYGDFEAVRDITLTVDAGEQLAPLRLLCLQTSQRVFLRRAQRVQGSGRFSDLELSSLQGS